MNLFFILISQLWANPQSSNLSPIVLNGSHSLFWQDPLYTSVFMILIMDQDGLTPTSLCTGTMVTSHLVLTAAHCVVKYAGDYSRALSPRFVRISTRDQDLSQKLDASELLPVARITLFPKLSPDPNDEKVAGDFALLTLATSLPPKFRPTKLAPSNQVVDSKSRIVVAGYGRRSQTDETLVGRLDRFSGYTLASTQQIGQGGQLLEMLASSESGDFVGDSGGPAFVQTSSGLRLFGVFSSFDLDQKSAWFGDVRPLLDWIQKTDQLTR